MSPGSYLRRDKLTRMTKHPPLLNRQSLKGAQNQTIGHLKKKKNQENIQQKDCLLKSNCAFLLSSVMSVGMVDKATV